MISDQNNVEVDEKTVLEKFEGEPRPENLIERIHIHNGDIVKWEKFEDGELVQSLSGDGTAFFKNVEVSGESVKEEN